MQCQKILGEIKENQETAAKAMCFAALLRTNIYFFFRYWFAFGCIRHLTQGILRFCFNTTAAAVSAQEATSQHIYGKQINAEVLHLEEETKKMWQLNATEHLR